MTIGFLIGVIRNLSFYELIWLITLFSSVVRSFLKVPTCGLNFITLLTCGGIYLPPLLTYPISVKKILKTH